MKFPKSDRVVHCKKSFHDVYIGRPGPWGNPFHEGTREENIENYYNWIQTQPHLMEKLHELKYKTLGCWCSPKECHGDVLIYLVKQLEFADNFS